MSGLKLNSEFWVNLSLSGDKLPSNGSDSNPAESTIRSTSADAASRCIIATGRSTSDGKVSANVGSMSTIGVTRSLGIRPLKA